MQILLVAQDESYRDLLAPFFSPRGCRIIHYRNPLKAQDNLREIEPEIILFQGADFPRHWKLMLQGIREDHTKKEVVFILLEDKTLPVDEADKALFLGANGIVYTEDLLDQDYTTLENLLFRYRLLPAVGSTAAHIPRSEEIAFIFPHPHHGKLISGIITELSLQEGSFEADAPADILDIEAGTLLTKGVLKIQGRMITLSAEVSRNMVQVLTLKWKNISPESRKKLRNHLLVRAGINLD